MITKIIHYCWFGNNKKTKLIKKCIASWKKYFPEYEIIEWNEDNTDLNENEYVKQAYSQKKWAFVSDFVRMKVLYEYGGIYFDTDVEVLRPFPDYIFKDSAFSGFEEFSGLVSPGLVFACEPGNEIVGKMIAAYNNEDFANDNIDSIKTINVRITDLLEADGLKKNDQLQLIDGIRIYPSNVFCGYDGENRRIDIKPETLSVHYYAHSWYPWYRKIRIWGGTKARHARYYIRKLIHKNSKTDHS